MVYALDHRPIKGRCPVIRLIPNKSLQVTFDPPPTFAAVKAGVASNAPELKRMGKEIKWNLFI